MFPSKDVLCCCFQIQGLFSMQRGILYASAVLNDKVEAVPLF